MGRDRDVHSSKNCPSRIRIASLCSDRYIPDQIKSSNMRLSAKEMQIASGSFSSEKAALCMSASHACPSVNGSSVHRRLYAREDEQENSTLEQHSERGLGKAVSVHPAAQLSSKKRQLNCKIIGEVTRSTSASADCKSDSRRVTVTFDGGEIVSQ